MAFCGLRAVGAYHLDVALLPCAGPAFPARAGLGDHDLKDPSLPQPEQAVSPEPELSVVDRSPDEDEVRGMAGWRKIGTSSNTTSCKQR